MTEVTINKTNAGQRLDKFISRYMKNAPKSFIYKMLRKKNITLNGRKAGGTIGGGVGHGPAVWCVSGHCIGLILCGIVGQS